jgi:hypothetical protein
MYSKVVALDLAEHSFETSIKANKYIEFINPYHTILIFEGEFNPQISNRGRLLIGHKTQEQIEWRSNEPSFLSIVKFKWAKF